MPAQTKTLQFVREKETKNAVRFAEIPVQGQAPVVGTLYVQKWFVGGANNVKVIIEPAGQ